MLILGCVVAVHFSCFFDQNVQDHFDLSAAHKTYVVAL